MLKIRYLFIAASLLLIGAGCPLSPAEPTPTPVPPIVHACTKEAKICPDGSSVGRSGPDCAFEACPTATACKTDADCKNGFCGASGEGDAKVCKAWRNEGESCGGFTLPSYQFSCRPDLTCVCSEPTCDAPGTCQAKPETPPEPAPKPVPCTLEAKQCPDGSYVGRQGPKCEFAPCPPAR